jgi:two-component system response regulator AgrA
MFDNSINYKIHSFEEYNDELKNIIKQKIGKKIYLLDIELKDKSGIEIAHEIRDNDWDSIIVIATAHSELFPKVFKDKLMLFDFISKFENYKDNLLQTINKIISIYSKDESFCFNIRKTNYIVLQKDILYLQFDKYERKTIVKTIDNEYKVSKSMKYLSKDLTNDFVRINNHCIINISNLKSYSGKGILVFKNGVQLNESIINSKEIEQHVLN